MKQIIFPLLFLLNSTLLLAQANPVLNEILYDPTGENSGNQLIEIKNIGDATADISGWWFCTLALQYTQLPSGVTIPAGGIIVIHVGGSGTNTSTDIFLSSMSSLSTSASDLSFYVNNSFTSSSSIRDFVQWGSGGKGRESVAVSAGIWTAGTFVPDVADGHSIEYDGSGNSPSDWIDQPVPTIGQENGTVTSVDEEKTLLKDFMLSQNYPNPFNPLTSIEFSIAHKADVKLTVFNILGQEIAVLVNDILDRGVHSVTWDASKYTSGIYFYTLEAGGSKTTKKLLYIK